MRSWLPIAAVTGDTMRTLAFIILCSVLFIGCSSRPDVTKQQVIDELAKIEGKEQAAKSYVRWMAELRPDCPDDATAHRKILESIQQIEKSVAGMVKFGDETKDRLLHQTDHQAVLAASREVIRARRDYKRDPKWHGPEDSEQSLIAADDPQLPLAIRKLGAASIFGYDDRLRIEFGGGFHHQGFVAYAETVTNTPAGREGFQKMIDGLWFYEDTK